MKNLFKIFLFLVIVLQTLVAQAQTTEPNDWIWQSEGIPIIGGIDWRWWGYHHPEDVKKMSDSAGVDVIMLDIYPNTVQNQMDTLDIFGFKGMPIRSAGYNYIQHYTDAKYSVWEAEGNDNYDVNLEYNSSVMDELTDGDTTFLKLKHTAAGLQDTELITGPYYSQDVKYLASQDNVLQIVRYLAEFRLKLEHNPYYPISDDPEDTICVIQVTKSKVPTAWTISCTDTIKERVLRREDFAQLNRFYDFLFHPVFDSAYYTLENNLCDCPDLGPEPQYTFHSYFSSDTLVPGPRWIKPYIQLKVIWKGDQQYLLSIDKVTVSDIRGRDLIADTLELFARKDIKDQANSLNSYNADGLITGWLGIDEPVSIDLFEPIRIVKDILEDNSQGKRPLWIAMMGHWDGAWENRENPFGAQGKSPWNELKNRVGRVNIIQNYYMFDSPCYPGSLSSACNTGEDYRSINIWRTALLNYKQAYELDPFYGVSLQCGAVKNTQANERNIARHELLYNANLALMFGAKYFHLYSYFAQKAPVDSLSGLTYHGIVDRQENFYAPLIYTDKYFMLKDTLSPRLKGLFGKTIKTLIPTEQFVGSAGINYYPPNPPDIPATAFLFVEDIYPLQISQYNEYGLDIGFFEDPLNSDLDYFMILNRYYSQESEYRINLRNIANYRNWKLTNYVDTTHITLIASENRTNFIDTLLAGDANLYSIAPVVKVGGSLIANDTIYTNTTLTDNMLINSAKSVYIKPGMFYTIQDTITLQGSGSTIIGEGYLEVAQGGEVIIYNWTNSLFKGKQSDHPKLFWGKFTGTGHTGYKIYRKKETLSFMEIASLSNSARTFTDTTVTIIEGQSQANEVEAEYYVKAIYNNGRSSSNSNTINYKRVEGSGQEKINTGLTRDNFTYQLQQNYPNPFNPVTQISYSIENDGLVELEVLNILGERVASLVSEHKTKGSYTIPFDASQLSSGIYIYRLRSKDFVSSKKMILLK